MGSRRFSGVALLFSVLGALLSFAVGEVILVVGSNWPVWLMIALYFGIGAMIFCAMILVSQGITPQLIGYRWREQYFKTSLKLFLPTTLIMLGIAAGAFQFIYGLQINEPHTIQDIVIAVDKSSSMTQTDPDGERFKAINAFIDHLKGDKRVAVMTFSDHAQLQIDFTNVSSKEEKENFKNELNNLNIKDDGQTGVGEVMSKAYELINGSSRKASMILVSDGSPTDGSDSDIPKLVENYVNDRIPVYTIGMMYTEPDADNYLHQIAELTGGTCYSTSDTTMLHEAFGSIKYNAEKGTILSARTGAYLDSRLHAALRIFFLTILAMMLALALGIMFDNKYLVRGMMIGSMIGGLLGAILMECLMPESLHPYFVRLLYWLLIGLCLMSFTWCITFKDHYHGTREA